MEFEILKYKKSYLQQYWYSTMLFKWDLTFSKSQNFFIDFMFYDFQIPRYYFNYIKIDIFNYIQ